MRGYVITGERVFLEPYEEGGRRVEFRLEELVELLAQDPELLEHVEAVRAAGSSWREQAAEVENRLDAGRPSSRGPGCGGQPDRP